MSVIRELYHKLYLDYSSYSKSIPNINDTAVFVPMKGSKYNDDLPIKLMIIGRAVYDWDYLIANSADEFGVLAEKQFESSNRFKWVEGTDDNLHHCDYQLNNSAFWKTSKAIWDGLIRSRANGNYVISEEQRWVEYICWSNLYKVAPKGGGNPTTTMCRAQFEACRDLLKYEIDTWKPTHILFVTGGNWIFEKTKRVKPECNFASLFVDEDNKEIEFGNEIVRNVRIKGQEQIKVLVTKRPENINNERYIKDVLNGFGIK